MIDEKKLIEEIKSLTVTITGLRAGKGILQEYAKHFKEAVLRSVEEQPRLREWIPCSERLPEITKHGRYSEDVITVLKWYDGDITYSVGWYNKCGAWNEDCDNCKVIAWQPLPEPYKL